MLWLLGYYVLVILAATVAIRLIVVAQTLGAADVSIWDYVYLATPLIGTLGTLFTTFGLLRLSGYRLDRGRRIPLHQESQKSVDEAVVST